MRKLLLGIVLISCLVLVCLVGSFGSLASAKTTGYVSIAFDDGWQTQYYLTFAQSGINPDFRVIY